MSCHKAKKRHHRLLEILLYLQWIYQFFLGVGLSAAPIRPPHASMRHRRIRRVNAEFLSHPLKNVPSIIVVLPVHHHSMWIGMSPSLSCLKGLCVLHVDIKCFFIVTLFVN